MKVKSKEQYRRRRHKRLRKKVIGTAERPRMAVFVSNKHLYVQFIDDVDARTLAAASTQGKGVKSSGKNDVKVAQEVGRLAAKMAKDKGIESVVFDRGGFSYKGRVQALADAAREAGLKF